MPIGKGNVLIGMSERTSRQAISQLAATLFKKGAAERVIVAAMPKIRAAMHLDTVFTFADRDCVLLAPGLRRPDRRPSPTARATTRAASSCQARRSRSSTSCAEALGLKKLRVVETGGNDYQRERTQWDSGANLVCASPGVVFAYDRNTYTNTLLRKAGHRGHHHRRRRTGPRARRRPLHDLPDHPRPGRLLIERKSARARRRRAVADGDGLILGSRSGDCRADRSGMQRT